MPVRLVVSAVLLALVALVIGTRAWQAPQATTAPSTTAGTIPGAAATSSHTAAATAPAGTGTSTPASAPAQAGRELPRGGTRVFPRYRLVGYSGGDGSAAFGRLGTGDLDRRVEEIERLGRRYADGRKVLPVLELIAVIAHRRPGADGLYRARVGDDVIERYLAAARRHRAVLLLNIQPGRADLLDEVRALRPWLQQPDVGVAVDPEWAVGPGQIPGRVFGSTDGEELDSVSRFLAGLVRTERLPQKVLVVHQLAPRVIDDIGDLRARQEVAVVRSVDGIGSRADKTATWRRLVRRQPAGLHPGFKLFLEEDARAGALMTPAQVLALRPKPEYVLYE